jgi:branched-chain amino acid transport system substrate-binding protein
VFLAFMKLTSSLDISRIGRTRLIVAVVALFSIQPVRAEHSSIKIGLVAPLTGAAAAFGRSCRVAAELAVKDLPQERRDVVKLLVEDDGLVNARSVAAGRKLMDIDQVHGLVSFSSSTALSLAPIVEQKHIPQIAIASDPAVARGRVYTFTYWVSPEREAELLCQHLEATGKKRVAILSVTHNGILAVRDALLHRIAQRRVLEVVASEEVSNDVLDFRGVLQRIRAREPFDAFIPIFFPGQLAVVIKQARALGIAAPLYGFETFEDKDEIAAAGGLMTDAVYATGTDPSLDFQQRLQALDPGVSSYVASNCYDSVRLLVRALSESTSVEQAAEILRTLKDYKGEAGLVSATGDNRFDLPGMLKTIDSEGRASPLHQ